MTNKKVSEARTFNGWTIIGLIKGNGKAIKEVLKFAVPFIISKMTIQYPGAEYLIGIIGKCVLDIAEFYLKKVNLNK